MLGSAHSTSAALASSTPASSIGACLEGFLEACGHRLMRLQHTQHSATPLRLHGGGRSEVSANK